MIKKNNNQKNKNQIKNKIKWNKILIDKIEKKIKIHKNKQKQQSKQWWSQSK